MTGRRRLRLREILPAPWIARMPEGGGYTPPPPDPAEDGPRRLYSTWPDAPTGILSFGQACLAFAAGHSDAVEAWRWNFPKSAEVFDGVRTTEAGVIPLDQPYTLEGEDDGR
ncbi:hypothetical protein C3V38_14480 [Dietzia sp. oral taxon 368]|uniref:hypothetical protein n=1 Tax=Dietzia sp. oral taxon 368 TaxID=712270 RepID=UPI000D08C2BC|nr:hypothetical protein [Dietzia sp. oral taxon 368]AVM65397.1 hypothetical protein C3V38_14480 [Dietzia sp. oral taxon 368]